MCVGIPMRVVEEGEAFAWCEGRTGRQRVNMLLVGPQVAGTWVLTFLDSARQVLPEEEARRIDAALDAVDAVSRGETPDVDSLFADLVNREPQRPDRPGRDEEQP